MSHEVIALDNATKVVFKQNMLDGDASFTQTYVVAPNGTIQVENDFKALKGKAKIDARKNYKFKKNEHPNIYKFGNEFVIPKKKQTA